MGLLDFDLRPGTARSAGAPAWTSSGSTSRCWSSVEAERVRVLSLRVEGGRLYLAGAAPSEDARVRILAAIRTITPETGDDIVADITVG